MTSLAFTLCGALLAWGLFHYRLLDIVPIARDIVIESMSDGLSCWMRRTASWILTRQRKLSWVATCAGEAPTPGRSVRIAVLDEGPGIPEEYRSRIFDKYEIVAIKRGGTPSVGLGLAFCKMVVEAHGGRILVDSNEPRGTVFTVEI